MSDILLPPLDLALVTALEKAYPPPVPRPSQSDKDIWIGVGEYRVVEFIRSQYEMQQEDILTQEG